MNKHPNRGGFGQIIGDCLDLFELQMQLISVDSQEARRKAVTAIGLGGVAAALGASILTVLMIGAGFLLHENTSLSIGGALITTCPVVGIFVAILSWVSIRSIKIAAAAMSETKSEFAENLRYLKAVLVSPETSPRTSCDGKRLPPVARPLTGKVPFILHSTHEGNSRCQRIFLLLIKTKAPNRPWTRLVKPHAMPRRPQRHTPSSKAPSRLDILFPNQPWTCFR